MRSLFFIIVILFFACSSRNEASKKESQLSGAPSKKNEVRLSEEQYKSIGITLGNVDQRSLSAWIKANGMLDVPPQNLVSISAPLGGFIKSTDLLQGMKVAKGQTIVVLEHPDYIQLQQDYLDNKSQLEYWEQEYTRQLDLSKENVTALKSLQLAKSNYFGTRARVAGLKAKLKLININPADIEKGEIKSSISIPSPINGFVAEVNVNLGMHVNPTDMMFKIVDTEHVHAEMHVFEKDIPKLKLGQRVRITLSNETKERIANVYLIGKEISAERTIRVHCHLVGEDSNLIPGTYFSGLIETGTNSESVLPTQAIVNFEGKHFLFIEKNAANHIYGMVEIEAGSADSGYTGVSAISGSLDEYKNKIVVKGAFELLNVFKNVDE